jgi:hypothetical protein
MKIRPGHLEPGCIGQGPAVKPMEGMGVKKSIKKSGAANIGHNGNLVAGKPDTLEGLIENLDDAFVSAARAKNGRAIWIQ